MSPFADSDCMDYKGRGRLDPVESCAKRMEIKQYDVVVVGGGIHGAGVLQAAAAAGHSALLIERLGLASGTSSRSSKLIHGGLRYLESGQFALVRESLRERAIHLRIAAPTRRPTPSFSPSFSASP